MGPQRHEMKYFVPLVAIGRAYHRESTFSSGGDRRAPSNHQVVSDRSIRFWAAASGAQDTN
jgi:hypothetical protein